MSFKKKKKKTMEIALHIKLEDSNKGGVYSTPTDFHGF
jgi:hypothetical protein